MGGDIGDLVAHDFNDSSLGGEFEDAQRVPAISIGTSGPSPTVLIHINGLVDVGRCFHNELGIFDIAAASPCDGDAIIPLLGKDGLEMDFGFVGRGTELHIARADGDIAQSLGLAFGFAMSPDSQNFLIELGILSAFFGFNDKRFLCRQSN